MKTLVFCIFFACFSTLFADSHVPTYVLWVRSTENVEEVEIGIDMEQNGQKVAGKVYRGRFDQSNKLIEVAEIYFYDYLDECVPSGYYEYVLYDGFPFDLCEKGYYCNNWEGITVPEHNKVCSELKNINMSEKEFHSMKHDYDYPDDNGCSITLI